MKCPACKSDHKRKYGFICTCGYMFVFDPKTDFFTDGKFHLMLLDASSGDTVYFTKNQLYTKFCKYCKYNPTGFIFLAVASLVIGLVLSIKMILWPLSILFAGLSIYNYSRYVPDKKKFESLLSKWLGASRKIEKLITKPSLHNPPPDWNEKDIYDYGVDKILIVEQDIYVDLFVVNNFHANEKTLVIAESGYPEYLLPVANQALKESSELKVFFLHDSTRYGEGMLVRLINSDKFHFKGHKLIDIGLFADDVSKLKRLSAIKPKSTNYEVSLDCLPYSALEIMAARAIFEEAPLRELFPSPESGDVGGFG